MTLGRAEIFGGRVLLIGLMTITVLPFISIFITALHPSGTLPRGLEWPAEPQWGNFVEAFKVANMTALLGSSVYIVLAVVPVALIISTMAGFAIGHLRIAGSRILLGLFVFGLTLPFGGIIVPLYYLERSGDLQHSAGDSAAIDWLIHAIRCVLDAHAFHQHAVGDFGGSTCRRCDDLGFVLADPASSGAAAYGSARDSHVGLDMEPVSPCARTGRRPHTENDGRRVRRIPGPLCN